MSIRDDVRESYNDVSHQIACRTLNNPSGARSKRFPFQSNYHIGTAANKKNQIKTKQKRMSNPSETVRSPTCPTVEKVISIGLSVGKETRDFSSLPRESLSKTATRLDGSIYNTLVLKDEL